MANIKINDKKYQATVTVCTADHLWGGRAVKAVTLEMTSAEAAQIWTDGTAWSIISADGIDIPQTEYAKAGTITDHRDGRVTVKMGKYTPAELAEIAYGGVPTTREEARSIRPVARRLAESASDADATVVRGLYPTWSELVERGEPMKVGSRLTHGQILYKARKAHTPSAAQIPGLGTESLYEVIDERHAGTADDPIPYTGMMSIDYGAYYIEDEIVYLCTRSSGQPIYHALADLVGIYVEAVS
jgi:hypothetical protein